MLLLAQLRAVDADNANHILPANRADVDLSRAGNAGTDMPAVVKQCVLLFAVTDLTQVHLLVGHFPVADALPVPFAVFVPADVLVAGLAFDEGPMPVAPVVDPVPVIRVA